MDINNLLPFNLNRLIKSSVIQIRILQTACQYNNGIMESTSRDHRWHTSKLKTRARNRPTRSTIV